MSPRDPGAPGPSAKKQAGRPRGVPAASDLKPNGKPRTIFWRMRRVFFAVALVFVLGIAGAGYLFTQVPLPEKEPPLLQTSFFCAADVTSGCNADNSIAQLSGSEDRISVTYDQLPPVLVQAVLAAEDRTFYDHGGVDPVGIVRALWANLRSDSVQQGGSTITQQYVKNVYLSQERTLTRKVKEAALAVKLERELPKQEILTRYLNTIYFGRGAYGVEAASRAYFGKSVGDITLPEAAYLAGLIRSPETADAQLAARGHQVRHQPGHRGAAPQLGAEGHGRDRRHHPGPVRRVLGARLGRRAAPVDQGGLRPRLPSRVGHRVLPRLRAPLARHPEVGRRPRLHRRRGPRRRPAGLHDPRHGQAGGGDGRRHLHAEPARRPGRGPRVDRRAPARCGR